MTTSASPDHELRDQAERMTANLKRLASWQHKRPSIKFGIAMDDKIIQIEMPWSTIRDSDDLVLVEYIMSKMRGERSQ